ncbi:MAG TPA: hypothetical protein VMP00_00470, partial [Burkholderiales bacterium]|nr:hypothetical protein [Burkholderiales bacterium]
AGSPAPSQVQAVGGGEAPAADKVSSVNRDTPFMLPIVLESLLKEAHIKLSSLVSDLLGTSARRMLQALADGETTLAQWRRSPTSASARQPLNCRTP